MESNHNQEDRNLWECMRGGDDQALATLFRRYYAILYDYGIKLSRQEELTKDGIQDIFAYLWEKRESLSTVDSVRAYLLVSFRRHLLKVLVKQRQCQNSHQEFSLDCSEDFFPLEDLIILEEKTEAEKQSLKCALEKIPRRIREALYLKTYDNLTYKEIAKIMNITPQVARNYVSEAFHRLRIIFKNNL